MEDIIDGVVETTANVIRFVVEDVPLLVVEDIPNAIADFFDL